MNDPENKPEFPLVLERLVFTRSVVIAIPNHKPNENPDPLAPNNTLDVHPMEENPRRYMVIMKSVFNHAENPTYPYVIDMECLAVFAADSSLPHDEALRAATITGHSVLYGAIREAVSWITGRQPYGPFMLGISVLKSA